MIDEKKLLEDLEKEIEFAKKCNMPQMVAGMNQVKSIIENQYKVGEWIPVSERLPEDARAVFVTCKGSEATTEAFYVKHFEKWYMLSGAKNIEVVAWMDKPEPYRERITMNKTNATQCESCTESTKQLVFCDAENESWNRWMCQNTDCPYNDMAEKQKSATEKRKEAQEINRKNGVDVRKLVKLRIRAQLSLVEAAEIVGVRTAQYSAWEYEREPIPIDKYNVLIDTMQGIYITSVGRDTLDESPMAYNPLNEILENIKDTVDVERIIKPVYNFKASE